MIKINVEIIINNNIVLLIDIKKSCENNMLIKTETINNKRNWYAILSWYIQLRLISSNWNIKINNIVNNENNKKGVNVNNSKSLDNKFILSTPATAIVNKDKYFIIIFILIFFK